MRNTDFCFSGILLLRKTDTKGEITLPCLHVCETVQAFSDEMLDNGGGFVYSASKTIFCFIACLSLEAALA